MLIQTIFFFCSFIMQVLPSEQTAFPFPLVSHIQRHTFLDGTNTFFLSFFFSRAY